MNAIWSATAEGVRTRAAAWARRRQGPDPINLVLRRRRIYILPTRFGLAFALLVFAMLLGSMNYASSLGFALTFLLTGLGLVAMHHCHNNLLGTQVRFAGAQPVFAGETAEFRILLGNDADAPRYELSVSNGESEAGPNDLQPGETKTVALRVAAERRGWAKLDRCAVSTHHPGNLFRAWSWLHMDARCVVYPRPAPRGRPLPTCGGAGGSLGTREHGDADFAGLRAAIPGDPPRRIAWKAYARNNELLMKQFASGQQETELLEWDSLPELATEERLSQLTRWCLDAAELDLAFGLVLPTVAVPRGSGRVHLHECLRALALYAEGESRTVP
jgi:uncharacterized protein (DUF58 family)